MAGRDQSANLSGMLNNISSTVGSMGKAYDPILETMKPSLPPLDPNDPDSIRRYMEAAQARGEMTPGLASQYGYMIQNAEKAQKKKVATDLVAGLDKHETRVNNIQQAVERQRSAGNEKAAVQLEEQLTAAQESLAALEGHIADTPLAADMLFDRTKREFDEDTMRNTMEARALAEQERVEREQEETVTNNYTAAIVSGSLPVDAPVLEQLKQTRPDLYEEVSTRASALVTAEQTLREDLEADPAAALPQEYFSVFENPEEAYKAYTQALSVSPKTANTNAIQARKSIDVARAKAGDDAEKAYKWTGTAEQRVSRAIRARINNLASEQPRVTKDGFFGESKEESEFTQRIRKMGSKRNNQGRALNDLVAEILNTMIAEGIEPTDEAIDLAIATHLSKQEWAQGVDFGVAVEAPAGEPAEAEEPTKQKTATDYL